MTCIKNANIVCENDIISDGVILIEGKEILKLGKAGEFSYPSDIEVIDANGLYVGPGFVDIHVHGGGDAEFFKEPLKAAEFFLRHGTTTVLPANRNIYDLDFYLDSFKRIQSAINSGGVGRCIAGVYMEGPYMNPKYGANPERNLWRGDILPERYIPLVDGANSLVKVWAIAPERDGIEPFLEYAKKVNPEVRFAVGHSEATPSQIAHLKDYGISIQTHCMDATGTVSTWEGTRGSGPDEYCFLDDDMFAELISDSGSVHVNSDLQRLILKVKGLEKVILITDSNHVKYDAPKGLERYTDLSFDPLGRLAGSKLTMNKACFNIMKHTGIGIVEAFLLASRNPAKAIGLENKIGTIDVGKMANLVFVNDTFDVKKVMLEGELI